MAPPSGGISSDRNRLAAGGTSTNELSVCQNASPSPRPPIALPFSTMLEITEISGGISLRRSSVCVLTPYCFSISAAGLKFEFAELAGEGHVLRVGHRLVAKPQHEMI